MTKLYASIAAFALGFTAQAQIAFDPSINITNWNPTSVVMPKHPLRIQPIFIGGHDYVQVGTNDSVVAKQWNDFIGFTPDTNSSDLGWITINHEMIQANPAIGDGGGMTSFKVKQVGDSLQVVKQTLADGRSGKFMNVKFNGTGNTGMNCGGIISPEGRIWTAEEWWQGSNAAIFASGAGFTDTTDFTIGNNTGISWANGQTIKRHQNLNWMVEIDPINAQAIRKQYNWGRQPFEGGAIASDNKTVYLGQDDTPGFFTKFVANTAGDFTSGNLFVYKENASGSKWIQLNNNSMSNALNINAQAAAAGATMFTRIEWFAINPQTGKVYFTCTGNDVPGNALKAGQAAGATFSSITTSNAVTYFATHPDSTNFHSKFRDYYGRVVEYDPATEGISAFLEGGPYLQTANAPALTYPNTHLANPDGLSFMTVNGNVYMVIQEDLNGTSYGRVPTGETNRLCEMFLYDMNDPNPALSKLMLITAVPKGAEITGAVQISNDIMLVNAQHPSTSNPFPYNNSLTFAIIGFGKSTVGMTEEPKFEGEGFQIYPNPASRVLHFNELSDVALYDLNGRRLEVYRNVEKIDVSHLAPAIYFVKNAAGDVQRLIVQ